MFSKDEYRIFNEHILQLILGLVEEQSDEVTQEIMGGRLTIWKRNRCGPNPPEGCAFINPIQESVWQKKLDGSFSPKGKLSSFFLGNL